MKLWNGLWDICSTFSSRWKRKKLCSIQHTVITENMYNLNSLREENEFLMLILNNRMLKVFGESSLIIGMSKKFVLLLWFCSYEFQSFSIQSKLNDPPYFSPVFFVSYITLDQSKANIIPPSHLPGSCPSSSCCAGPSRRPPTWQGHPTQTWTGPQISASIIWLQASRLPVCQQAFRVVDLQYPSVHRLSTKQMLPKQAFTTEFSLQPWQKDGQEPPPATRGALRHAHEIFLVWSQGTIPTSCPTGTSTWISPKPYYLFFFFSLNNLCSSMIPTLYLLSFF